MYLDKTSQQLLADTRNLLPCTPARPVRADHQYRKRHGESVSGLCAVDRCVPRTCDVAAQERGLGALDESTADRTVCARREGDFGVRQSQHACAEFVLRGVCAGGNTPVGGANREVLYAPKHGWWLNVAR